jgi:Fe-S-cluster containining protein
VINKKQNTKDDLKDICLDCEGHCCKLGGVVATQNEVDAITKLGYPNYFVQLSNDVCGIEWENDGSCPYLMNGLCSIYSVRPLGCRIFPVIQDQNHDVTLIECPLSFSISDNEIEQRKQILIQRPNYIIRQSVEMRSEHIKNLTIRATRYSHKKI